MQDKIEDTCHSNQNHSAIDLGCQKISSLIWKFFWPTVFASVLGTVNNIVDRIYIGQAIGAEALAAITIIFPIMMIVVASSAIVSTGTSVLIGTRLGQKNKDRAEEIFGTSIILSIIIGIISVAIIYLLKYPLLKAFGISETTMVYANDYLSILMWSWSFAVLGSNFTGVAKTEGNIKISMLAASAAVCLNIIFDPIFIFGLDMGVKGAAWASNITNMFLFGWGIYHFKSHHSVIKIKISKLKINPKITLRIIKIGFAPFAMMLASSLVQGLTNSQLSKYGGDVAIAVLGVIFAIMGLMMFLTKALGSSLQPIVSFNNGAKKYNRVNEAVFLCMKFSTIISCIAFAIINLFPEFFIHLFNKDNQDFLNMGVTALRLSTLGLPFYGVLIVGTQYFTAMRHYKTATFLSLLHQVIIYIPALFIMTHYYELNGAWLANSISIILSSIIVVYYIVKEIARLKKLAEHKV